MKARAHFALLLTIPAFIGLSACSDAVGDTDLQFCTEPLESTPSSEGIDPVALDQIYRQAEQMPDLLSLLVVRHDLLVCEAYFRGYDATEAFNVKSVSKSILSAVVGIAIEEGHIPSLDTPIAGYFPEYYPDQVDDARKESITVRHLLNMTGGWQWGEAAPVFADWAFSSNWNDFLLALPLSHDPGQTFNYTTAGTHLLATLMNRAVPGGLLAYAEDRLFGPVGMTLDRWDTDPQGNPIGGAEMFFTARDMAKFGILFMNGGSHSGEQVVPAAWVQASTQMQADPGTEWDYGYLWWLRSFAGRPSYHAWGFGGQFVFNIPSLDLIVVVTSTLRNQDAYWQGVFDLLEDQVLPAVTP